MAEDPANADWAVVRDPGAGQPYSRYFLVPRSSEDLLLRRRLIEEGARRCFGIPPFAKEGGTDALLAILIVAAHVDQQTGSGYLRRAQDYLEHLKEKDLSVAVAMTDVKGDRALRPSRQAHPDYYVHVVDEGPDGIVIRGGQDAHHHRPLHR